mmetsp:Transcript_168164/g.540190  ORF Transcript_168164/g.540190 Transcript_168164/m.540190 type:complete len:240 (+) Transcript_168164:1027-1746(+)
MSSFVETSTGAWPCSSYSLGSDPCSKSTDISVQWPAYPERQSGVRWNSPRVLGLARRSRSNRTADSTPPLAASDNAVVPLASLASTGWPPWSIRPNTVTSPSNAAARNFLVSSAIFLALALFSASFCRASSACRRSSRMAAASASRMASASSASYLRRWLSSSPRRHLAKKARLAAWYPIIANSSCEKGGLGFGVAASERCPDLAFALPFPFAFGFPFGAMSTAKSSGAVHNDRWWATV